MRLTAVLQCTRKLPKDYSNLPESYIKRAMAQVEWKTPNKPNYLPRTIERKQFRYGMARPWTKEFYTANRPGLKVKAVHVQPIEWSIFRGDRVEILVGKDKGKQGIVNMVVKERNWVTVQGLNCTYRVAVTGNSKQMYKYECPLLVTTQVSLVDPSTEKITEVEWRFLEDGTRVRVAKASGRIIPIPVLAHETYDYATKESYVDKPKDTPAKELEKITYVPKLATFAMDIAKEMEIKDNRIPAKTYWY